MAVHPGTAYVDSLSRGLEGLGIEVERSALVFDRPDAFRDVVHVHWPEALCAWERPTLGRLRKISETLTRWRAQGAALVVTRHNARPHFYRDGVADELYQTFLERADGIIHLGNASRAALAGDTSCRQTVIPLGADPHVSLTGREEARSAMRIPTDAYVVLVFGAIRHFEEQRLTLDAVRSLRRRTRNVVLLAPRWVEATRPSWKSHPLQRMAAFLADRKARRLLRVGGGFVEEHRVGWYFGAADIVFIPRIDVLNSDILPQAYAYERAVVGPRTGNLTEILDKTGNFTYPPGDADAAARALDAARGADLAALGARNRSYAAEHWNWESVSRAHLGFYEQLAGGRSRGGGA
jgi:glycosyltransferase involved in cell wall biosynthesis